MSRLGRNGKAAVAVPVAVGALVGLTALWAIAAPGAVRTRGAGGADVTVADFAWLEGTWRGDGPGGSAAEIHYMEPSAGVLPAVFRLVQDGRVVVLELITLAEEEDGLHMYVRHFSPDLTPLEEGHPIALRLVEAGEDTFRFENVRDGNPTVGVVMRTPPDAFVSLSELRRADGSADTIRVEYGRLR